MEDWETQSEARLFGELLALLCFELCGKREMLGSLGKVKNKRDIVRSTSLLFFLVGLLYLALKGISLNIIQLS